MAWISPISCFLREIQFPEFPPIAIGGGRLVGQGKRRRKLNTGHSFHPSTAPKSRSTVLRHGLGELNRSRTHRSSWRPAAAGSVIAACPSWRLAELRRGGGLFRPPTPSVEDCQSSRI